MAKAVNRRTEIFEHIPVRRAVCMQVIPTIASQMIMLIYNLADTYFVGLLNAPAQTAAITVVAPCLLMLTAISNLFGVGGSSALARALGKKNTDGARQISSVSFWGGTCAALLFSVAFWLLAEPILHLFGAREDTIGIGMSYARWVVIIGGPFSILNMLLANLVRAQGNAAAASVGVSLGGLINILLDPVFVLPSMLGFGAMGAGMATAISNAAGTVFFLCYLYVKRRTSVVSIQPGLLRYTGKHIGTILSIGLPSALQFALTVVGTAAQTRFVANYGTEAVAAFGIDKKLDQLPLFFSIGTANGLLPLLAYNHSAGNQERRRKAFRFGCLLAVSFSTICLVLYEFLAPILAGFFIDDPMTVDYAAQFLRRMVVGMPLMAISYPMIIQFQAMGKARESLITSIVRKGVIDIPLLFLMDAIYPLYGCVWVQPMVDVIAVFVAGALYLRLKRREGV